jgi:hypothetical protein
MIIQKKNIIKKETVKKINKIVSSGLFPWFLFEESYQKTKHLGTPFEKKLNEKYKSTDTFQLVHVLYKKNDSKKSLYYSYFYELFEEIVNKLIKRDVELLRMKINLLFNKKEKTVNNFHLDDKYDQTFKTIIYYINDSDGDTVIYDNKKLIRIKPEAGKVLLFDGDLYHASSSPVKTKLRKVVNINFRYV